MTTLVVGCGYLGRRVGSLLVGRGERVVGTVRSAERAARIAALGIEPAIADVLRPDSLAALPQAERIFYSVGFDRGAGVPMRTVYVEGLRNALQHQANRGVRWVYASSTGVYGGNDGGWIDEDTPALSAHEAGVVCLDAEHELRRGGEAHGLDPVVLRFAGLYGPGRIIGRDRLRDGRPIVGDPDKFLNLIHVDDAATAVVAALDRGGRSETYLVADDRPVARREYYGLAARLLGVAPPTFVAAEGGSPGERREDSNKRIANRRLRERLGVVLRYPDITAGLPAALENEPRA